MTVTIMVSICPLLIFCVFSYAYENIALHKPAWQSSQYKPGNDLFNASNAVDGLKSNLHRWGGQCVASRGKTKATWRVDLEDIRSIHHVTIYYRTENKAWGSTNKNSARFVGFSLYVSNTTDRTQGELCFHDTNYTRATIPAVLNVMCPVHGQYVIYYNERLQGKTYPDGYSTSAYNDVCEVEVYGCPRPGFYGVDCSLPCPDVNCKYCHVETGACQACKPGYKGHRCQLVDNQVQEEETGNKWKTMFYGVLGAFCATLVVVGVVVFVIYKMSKRQQPNRDINKKHEATESPSTRRDMVTQDYETVNSEYQELGELSPSSPYDFIQ